MICIARLKRIPCEVCGNTINIVCFWFDGLNAIDDEADYLKNRQDGTLGEQTDLAGELLSKKFLTKLPGFAGRYVGYKPHMIKGKGGKKEWCAMSGHATKNEALLETLLKEVKVEESREKKKEPTENEIATKEKPEKPRKERGAHQKNFDLFAEASKGLRALGAGFRSEAQQVWRDQRDQEKEKKVKQT